MVTKDMTIPAGFVPVITMRQIRWIVAIGIFVAMLAAGYVDADDIRLWIDDHRENIENFLKHWRTSLWAPVAVWTVYVAAGLTCFPVTVVSVVVAAVFGFMDGILYGLSGALLSAALLFSIGRGLGQDRLQKLMRRGLTKIDRDLNKNGIAGVAALRMILVIPFTLFNLLLGVSSVRYRDFMIGSLIGMLPGFIARGMVGDSLVPILLHPSWGNVSYLAAGLIFWLAMLAGAHVWQSRTRA